MPDEFELSRRKALAALGTVGAASAGAGLGTSAFFSDQETFENNQLTAGTLDMKVSWEEHYSDWSEDEAEHAHMEDGELVVDDLQGFMDATLQEQFPDKQARKRLNEGTADPCEVLADVPDDLEKPVIELEDVKPGDFGEVTFDFALCDNPGYVWMNGELLSNAENGVTEPEADDPDEQLPGRGELADTIQTTVWYDKNGNNRPWRPTPCVERIGHRQDLLVCKASVDHIPPGCGWFARDEIYVWCEGSNICPIDKGHVYVVHPSGSAICRIEITPLERFCSRPDQPVDVWEWKPDWTDLPCATRTDGPQERCVCEGVIADIPGVDSPSQIDAWDWIDVGDPIWILCVDAPEGPVADPGECVDMECPTVPGGGVWLRNPQEEGGFCLVEIDIVDPVCRLETVHVWEIVDDWNRQPEEVFFSGTLRETMDLFSQGVGIPLDGRPVTDFTEIADGRPTDGTAPTRECYTPAPDRHHVGFEWELPVDHGNEVQSDSVAFDLGFYTEQCRHNDGGGMNDEPVDDAEPSITINDQPAGSPP
ncbi:SipW-dependent-type signal peptide-containing protein [Haloplanus aerogenes]|nr:SipW-dependent-type signal peptide-containing protein [Haloplanus aerogenes]RMB13542.1 putative ribosomally synthesized peptide with SipW-like signal peptide [Haloplanus aerogenes]